ncbi:unnamed protein product [Urochloa humidicola]
MALLYSCTCPLIGSHCHAPDAVINMEAGATNASRRWLRPSCVESSDPRRCAVISYGHVRTTMIDIQIHGNIFSLFISSHGSVGNNNLLASGCWLKGVLIPE